MKILKFSLVNFLNVGQKFSDEADFRQVKLITIFSITGSLALFLFGGFHLFSGETTSAIIELGMAVLTLINLYKLRTTLNLRLASNVILILMLIVLSYLLVNGGIRNTGILWFYTFPALAFFLKGTKGGVLWMLALLGTIIYLQVLRFTLPGFPFTYSVVEVRQLVASLAVVGLLVYVYALVNEASIQKIKLQDEQLKSEKENVEEKIEQRTRELKAILDTLPVGVFIAKAPSGVPTLLNPFGAKILGRGLLPEATKKNYAEVYAVVKEDGSPYKSENQPVSITLETGKAVHKDDLFIRHPDGVTVALRVNSAPILDENGKLVSVVAVFEDITRERQIDKMKDEFVAVASHELRTPMTAIAGFVDMIKEGRYGKVNKNLSEPLGYVASSTDRLIELVNDLLNVSRIEAGRMKFTISTFDLGELLAEIVNEIKPVASKKGLKLQAKADKKTLVAADREKVRQVVNNLLGNALKFTDKGSVVVSSVEKEDRVLVSVVDTGIGIAKSDQSSLFGKFQQIANVSAGRPPGTGLGLYLSREIVRKMNGDLTLAKSTPGKGSAFVFTLPLSKK